MTDITYPISYPTSFLSNLEVEQMVDSYFMIMSYILVLRDIVGHGYIRAIRLKREILVAIIWKP
jgi:hypothetical protein